MKNFWRKSVAVLAVCFFTALPPGQAADAKGEDRASEIAFQTAEAALEMSEGWRLLQPARDKLAVPKDRDIYFVLTGSSKSQDKKASGEDALDVEFKLDGRMELDADGNYYMNCDARLQGGGLRNAMQRNVEQYGEFEKGALTVYTSYKDQWYKTTIDFKEKTPPKEEGSAQGGAQPKTAELAAIDESMTMFLKATNEFADAVIVSEKDGKAAIRLQPKAGASSWISSSSSDGPAIRLQPKAVAAKKKPAQMELSDMIPNFENMQIQFVVDRAKSEIERVDVDLTPWANELFWELMKDDAKNAKAPAPKKKDMPAVTLKIRLFLYEPEYKNFVKVPYAVKKMAQAQPVVTAFTVLPAPAAEEGIL